MQATQKWPTCPISISYVESWLRISAPKTHFRVNVCSLSNLILLSFLKHMNLYHFFKTFFLQLCIKKTFSLRKSLFFVLVLFLVLITAHFHCYTHFPHFRSASNQNTFKVLSLFVFRKTSNIKTNYKADCKFFSLQTFQFEKYESK